jgi:hypothetical protein
MWARSSLERSVRAVPSTPSEKSFATHNRRPGLAGPASLGRFHTTHPRGKWGGDAASPARRRRVRLCIIGHVARRGRHSIPGPARRLRGAPSRHRPSGPRVFAETRRYTALRRPPGRGPYLIQAPALAAGSKRSSRYSGRCCISGLYSRAWIVDGMARRNDPAHGCNGTLRCLFSCVHHGG